MNFSAADITSMLAAFGDSVIIGMQLFFDDLGNFDDVATLAAVGTTGGVTYPCEYSAPGKGVNMFTGTVETSDPAVIMSAASAAVAGVAYGTPAIVNGLLFYVTAIDPDGTGFTMLTLTKEAP